MRRVVWLLLLAYVFAVPWEYSLDLGEPLGNVARIVGLLLLSAVLPAMLLPGRARMPGPLLWLVLALYLWFCCTVFWSMDSAVTIGKLRGYFQEMMVVWMVWEFAESPLDLRALLRATVLGGWLLAILTLVEFRSAASLIDAQVRFAAYGQDPNDVARYLDLGLPMAALLGITEQHWAGKLVAYSYLPVAFLTGLLTASRGGFLAAGVAIAGSLLILLQGSGRVRWATLFAILAFPAGVWLLVPGKTLERLTTIPEQLAGGSLNQRFEIWFLGWRAFVRNPLLGAGVGNFTLAAGLATEDTAHNTVLSVLVGGGLLALFLCIAIVLYVMYCITRTRSILRISLATTMAVWLVMATVATEEESRFTWLIIALVALAGRLALDCPVELNACFSLPGAKQPAVALSVVASSEALGQP